MKMKNLYSFIHYWLVDHPIVSKFEWKKDTTFGSSFLFLTSTVLTYLSLTFLLHKYVKPELPNAVLRGITAVHNIILCLLSLLIAVGCSLSTLHQMPNNDWTWIVCMPVQPNHRGPTFFWAQVFYLSKPLEFVDTLLIILGGPKSRRRRLSFLHVYHHAAVVIMCYLWLYTSQTMFPVGIVTNASVHVLMYGYYLLRALGIRPTWKRFVTDSQIMQFVFGFVVSGLMLYYHFTGPGCSGILGWCLTAGFNASLLVLFLDFHSKNYSRIDPDKER